MTQESDRLIDRLFPVNHIENYLINIGANEVYFSIKDSDDSSTCGNSPRNERKKREDSMSVEADSLWSLEALIKVLSHSFNPSTWQRRLAKEIRFGFVGQK